MSKEPWGSPVGPGTKSRYTVLFVLGGALLMAAPDNPMVWVVVGCGFAIGLGLLGLRTTESSVTGVEQLNTRRTGLWVLVLLVIPMLWALAENGR